MAETNEQKPQSAPVPAMSEAGFSINVKMLDPNGQEAQLTFRCARASDSVKLLNHYSSTIHGLMEMGWTASRAASRPSNGGESPDASAPKCKYHGTPMKASRKPGSFFCPRKAGEGYCDYKIEGGSN